MSATSRSITDDSFSMYQTCTESLSGQEPFIVGQTENGQRDEGFSMCQIQLLNVTVRCILQ